MSGNTLNRAIVARLQERGLDTRWLKGIAKEPRPKKGSAMSPAAMQVLSDREVIRAVGRVPGRVHLALWGPGKFYDTLMRLLEAKP